MRVAGACIREKVSLGVLDIHGKQTIDRSQFICLTPWALHVTDSRPIQRRFALRAVIGCRASYIELLSAAARCRDSTRVPGTRWFRFQSFDWSFLAQSRALQRFMRNSEDI
ncbi:unnamed protein product [Trichogramma brassicae]|uniref:Uncharacterized protein n=1 Tax=Trichogramma brassicae TaxID=86971 RepID=A0A6H5IL12_9HYME|nr:unnamed protein product [Trichogramma brassicae]